MEVHKQSIIRGSFYADDKFVAVIDQLLQLGFERSLDHLCADIVYTNLAKVDFQTVNDRIVNHLKGSQHLSNKSLLAYHVLAAGKPALMPTQWSSSFQSFHELLTMLLEQSIRSATACTCSSPCLSPCPCPSSSSGSEVHHCWEAFRASVDIDAELSLCLQLKRVLTEEIKRAFGGERGSNAIANLLEMIDSYEKLLLDRRQANNTCDSISNISSNSNSDSDNGNVMCGLHQWQGCSNVFIVKPVGLSCGEQISVCRGIRATLAAAVALARTNADVTNSSASSSAAANSDLIDEWNTNTTNADTHVTIKCIVQKYIERPLLVRNHRKKFDIRQWILVTSVNPLVMYGFSECYARLSAQDYNITGDDVLSDATVHLCNHSIQKFLYDTTTSSSSSSSSTLKLEREFDKQDEGIGDDVYCETMMTQSQLEREFLALQQQYNQNQRYPQSHCEMETASEAEQKLSENPFQTHIVPQIKSISVAVVESVRDKLMRVGKGFEWLGLDLMIAQSSSDDNSSKQNPWVVKLLEVNVSPDISFSTPVTSRLIRPAVQGLFDIILSDSTTAASPSSSTSSPSANSLQWELWHKQSSMESFMSLRSFAKSKAAVRELGGANSSSVKAKWKPSSSVSSMDESKKDYQLQCAVLNALGIVAPTSTPSLPTFAATHSDNQSDQAPFSSAPSSATVTAVADTATATITILANTADAEEEDEDEI